MIDEYALLAMLKTETLTEFHEELFDLVENGGFELGFGIDIGFGQIEKLEGHWVAKDVTGLHGFGFLLDVAFECCFVL